MAPQSPTLTRGSHNPNNPAVSAEGTARSLGGKSLPKAPEGYGLQRRNEGLLPNQHRFNSPQVMASNSFPDVKPMSSYTGAPGTKAEKAGNHRAYLHELKGNSGDPGHNNVVLNESKYGLAYAKENGNGRFTREGSGEVAYTSAAARVEDSHQGRFGRKNFGVGAHGFSEASAFSFNEASLRVCPCSSSPSERFAEHAVQPHGAHVGHGRPASRGCSGRRGQRTAPPGSPERWMGN